MQISRTAWWLIILACVAALLLLALVGAHHLTGTVPEWIEALSTLAAFGAAAVAAVYAGNAFRLEYERSSQAAQVAAWHKPPDASTGNGTPEPDGQHSLEISNASRSPVYGARAALFLDGRVAAIIRLRTVVPNTAAVPTPYPDDVNVLVRHYLEQRLPPEEHRDPQIAISFADTAQRLWNRDRFGDLRQGRPDWFSRKAGVQPDFLAPES